jgi:hypothetical protein
MANVIERFGLIEPGHPGALELQVSTKAEPVTRMRAEQWMPHLTSIGRLYDVIS